MFEPDTFLLFLAGALVIAAAPGPGILYVAARTLAGGRREGLASSLGTGLGGLVHVLAGAVGVSAIVVAGAEAFAMLKLFGAAYLIWLGSRMIWKARLDPPIGLDAAGARRALGDGLIVEALNPKTAVFFLAFIPQFVDPAAGGVGLQFAVLGLVSVVLNTLADVIVALAVASARAGLLRRPRLIHRLRQGGGLIIVGLGLSLLLGRRPVAP